MASKKPPQGTTGIRNLAKEAQMVKRQGRQLADAIMLASQDPLVSQLMTAKAERNKAELGRLIPLVRDKYGQQVMAGIVRSLPPA